MSDRPGRYESLDSWRGVACLLVVLLHSAVYATGDGFDTRVLAAGGSVAEWVLVAVSRFWIGVPIFFVISGYCIAATADKHSTRVGGVRRFIVHRVRRIYPPLWAALGLAAVVLLILPAALRPAPTAEGIIPLGGLSDLTVGQWIGNLSLTEEWRPALGGSPKGYLLAQIWTLCYEEQFYLVVGLVLLVARRWLFPVLWAITVLILLNLADLNALVGTRLGVDLSAYQIRVAGLFTDGLWIAFAAGVAVYYRCHRAVGVIGFAAEFLILAVGLAAAREVAAPWESRQTLVKYNVVACGFALLLCRLHRFDTVISGARWISPLRFCGRMCYSLYLTHPLVAVPAAWVCHRSGLTSPVATVLVTLPICALLSVVLGYAFHRVVERRFISQPDRGGPRPAIPDRVRESDQVCPGPSLSVGDQRHPTATAVVSGISC